MDRTTMLFPGGKTKAFTLSYDDGAEADRKLAELCRSRGVKCTFNLNSFRLGEEKYLKAGEVRELFAPDMAEVATHGFNHPFLNQLPSHAAFRELLDDRLRLEELTGCIVRGHAYPFGVYNAEVIDLLKAAGITYARTIKSTHEFRLPESWYEWNPTCHHDEPELMELADRFLQLPDFMAPSLFYVWGHSYEFAFKQNWETMERLLDRLGGRDEIWFATNMEIHDCAEAFNRLVWSANCGQVFNPSAREVWFSLGRGMERTLRPLRVRPGETLDIGL
jgi:hypothetical protein